MTAHGSTSNNIWDLFFFNAMVEILCNAIGLNQRHVFDTVQFKMHIQKNRASAATSSNIVSLNVTHKQ